MSEMISSIIDGIKDRTSGIYGYLTTSFIFFNWSNIYFLLFSTKTAEQKIVSMSLSFSIFWNAFIPFVVGVLLCLVTPFISSGIKEVHTRAIWWNKRIEFKNNNYSEDLAEERRLNLIEKQNTASNLERDIENSNRRLGNLNDLYKTLYENNTKLSSQESSLLAEIANKRDELQKLEIQIAQESQEYSNFKSMKKSYNSLAEKNNREKLKHQLEIEKTLGILKALIDEGYIPETVENTIILQLNTIGIDIPTKNPLRKTQRRHAVTTNKNGKDIEVISYSPTPIEIPSKNSLNNEWNHD